MSGLMSRTPAVPAAVGLCVGIFFGVSLFPDLSSVAVAVIAICGVVAAVAVYLLWRNFAMAASVLAVGLGVLSGHNALPPSLPSNVVDTRGTAVGTVVKAKDTELTTRITVDVTSWTPHGDSVAVPVDFRLLVNTTSCATALRPGARVTLTGKIQPLTDNLDLPYQTDYNRYLFTEGVSGRMFVRTEDCTADDGDVPWFDDVVDTGRDIWLDAIVNAGFDEDASCFMLAIIGGEDGLLGEDLEEDFRQTGLSHILALSGLHVGVVVAVLAFLLYPVKLGRRLRYLYFGAVGFFVIVFALITGGSPSVCRAAAMCCVLMGARIFETQSNPFQSLSVAVIILLAVKPLWLYMPGFQLSVAAVLAIITFLPKLDFVPRSRPILRAVWLTMVLPVVAVVGTLVLTLFYFHAFSLNFWAANMLASVFVPLMVGLGIVAALISAVGLSPGLLSDAVNVLYALMRDSVSAISGAFPDSRIPLFPSDSQLVAMTLSLVIIGWLMWHYTRRRAVFSGIAIAALVVLAVLTPVDVPPRSELYVPRHKASTDIIVVHNGRGYLWSDARRKSDADETRRRMPTLYRDFFANRNISPDLAELSDGLNVDGLQRSGAVLTLNGRSIVVIDSLSAANTPGHVNLAIVTGRYKGNMPELVAALDADTLILHTSINHSRLKKFERQLDTLQVVRRTLASAPVIWQFR